MVITPQTLMAAGNFLSGAADFGGMASGFLGGGGATSAQKLDAKRTRRMEARYQAKELPALQVYGWKKAGIHPLAGIGMNPASGMAGTVAGDIGENLGQNISRAMGNVGQGIRERQLHELTVERMKLENEGQHLANMGQRSRLKAEAGEPPIPVQLESSREIMSRKDDTGTEAASTPLYKDVDMGRGKKMKVPSPEIADAVEGAGVPAGTYLSAKLAADLLGRDLLEWRRKDKKYGRVNKHMKRWKKTRKNRNKWRSFK